jgi:hypothetical protein
VRTGGEFLPTEYLFNIPQGSFASRKFLRHGADGFTSRPKEVLWTFIAIKNPSPSTGFESANIGSNGKHDNH